MDSEPHTFFTPRPEIVVYGFIMRKVRRKSSPLTTRFEHIKKKFPNATYVEVADGAPDNWTFLEPFVSYRVLDFYHVSEYVADAAEAAVSRG